MTNTQSQAKPNSIAGRVWKASMGLFLVGIGSLFVWYLWASYQKAKAMDTWLETPALMLRSEVIDIQSTPQSNQEYLAQVRYQYEIDGKTYESELLKLADGPSASQGKIARKIESYPNGAMVTAWVNPDDPNQSVLKRNTKAALYTIWFPLLFVIGGLGMMLSSVTPSSFWRWRGGDGND
ncbi:MAG: DUF3592 domain-containing protein [Verrucomicrobiota bacterium]